VTSVPADKCLDVDCGKNGTCMDGDCLCDVGYDGNRCERDICLNTMCDNGLCNPVNGKCVCDSMYTGDLCSILTENCSSDEQCTKGTCVDESCVLNTSFNEFGDLGTNHANIIIKNGIPSFVASGTGLNNSVSVSLNKKWRFNAPFSFSFKLDEQPQLNINLEIKVKTGDSVLHPYISYFLMTESGVSSAYIFTLNEGVGSATEVPVIKEGEIITIHNTPNNEVEIYITSLTSTPVVIFSKTERNKHVYSHGLLKNEYKGNPVQYTANVEITYAGETNSNITMALLEASAVFIE
jgi:hypothetical protein